MRVVINSSNISWGTIDDDGVPDPELKSLLEGPEINGMWFNTLDKLRDLANELAQTEDANYGSAVHQPDNEWGFEPGGYIYTENYKARVDNYHHKTLLDVFAMAPTLAAESFDLGKGYAYDPRGRGSNVRGPDGRFAPSENVKRGGSKRGSRKTGDSEGD